MNLFSLRRISLLVLFVVLLAGCFLEEPGMPESSTPEVDAGQELDVSEPEADVPDPGPADPGPTDPDPTDPDPTDPDPTDPDPDPTDPDPTDPDPTDPDPTDPIDPTNPPDPESCGGNYWSDHHDGSNPWEDFDLDCDAVSASWDCQAAAAEEQILAMLNAARAEQQTCGGSNYGPSQPLVMDPQLRCAARLHSWDMSGRNYYAHQTPEGLSPSGRVSLIPGINSSAAENIYQWWASPQAIFDGWMNSAGHCRNMLCGSHTRVGIGIYNDHHTMKITGPGFCF